MSPCRWVARSCRRRGPAQDRLEARSQLVLVVTTGEVEQRMWRQWVLRDGAVLADVEDGIRITLAVRLECGRDGVASRRIHEGLQRDDAFVGDPGVAIEIDHAGQVGALVPELRPTADLFEQVRKKGGRVQAFARCRNAELCFGQVPSQHPRVVAIPLNSTRVAWDAMLLEPRGTLGDGAGEEEALHGRAFPERGLGRQPALTEGLDTEFRQVAERRDGNSGGNDVVGPAGWVLAPR